MKQTLHRPVALAKGAPIEQRRGLPGMRPDVRRVYDGIVASGATTAASARPLADIGRRLKLSKHTLQDALRDLEGKGVLNRVGGHDPKWFAGR